MSAQDNPLLHGLVPHIASRGYVPTVGGWITLSLPGEMVRAKVLRVTERGDRCIVSLEDTPLLSGRGQHTYKKGNVLPARRIVDSLLQAECWEVIPERDLTEATAEKRLQEEEAAKQPPPPPEPPPFVDPSGT